jgi:hypothetical protein
VQKKRGNKKLKGGRIGVESTVWSAWAEVEREKRWVKSEEK